MLLRRRRYDKIVKTYNDLLQPLFVPNGNNDPLIPNTNTNGYIHNINDSLMPLDDFDGDNGILTMIRLHEEIETNSKSFVVVSQKNQRVLSCSSGANLRIANGTENNTLTPSHCQRRRKRATRTQAVTRRTMRTAKLSTRLVPDLSEQKRISCTYFNSIRLNCSSPRFHVAVIIV